MRNERGLSNGVQLTLLFPLAFSVLLLTLQWALTSWASATALAAAQDGARQGAMHPDFNSVQEIATTSAGNGSLTGLSVEITIGSRHTQVTVTGNAVSVIPGWQTQVSETASRPAERVTRS